MDSCQLYKYNDSFYLHKNESASYFSQKFAQNDVTSDSISWLNFHGISEKDNITALCESLKIDKLCIESIFSETRRAKVEEYEKYAFFSIKSAIDENNYISSEEITFVLSNNYLISFQEKPADYFNQIRFRITHNEGVIRKKTSDFLLFRMLESIVDNYFNAVESINEEIFQIDKILSQSNKSEILKKIEHEKKKLLELKKIVIPMRDISIQLENANILFIHNNNRNHFVNLRFLCESVLEEIDASKQILDGLNNLYYAAQGQRMNEIIKILTIVSTIFIPLTFIAGVYGMNFLYMPELRHPLGYFWTLGIMTFIGIALLGFFWGKGWLKK